jgi:xanthine dehydrogenase accessory factor
MRSADHEVLTTATDWLDAGHDVFLVTVARTWGSSPRPPGALLAVRAADGRFAGSVSGGCVEDDLAARLAAHGTQQSFPRVESYGVTVEQTSRFGLPCGGRLDLVVERLTGVASLRPLLQAMDERRCLMRRVCLATGEASIHPAASGPEFRFDGAKLDKVFGPAWRLVLIGSGQLSRFVAEMAQALDYTVVVCDPRDDIAAAWQVPGTVLDSRSPDVAVREHAGDARTAVLALTHDPRLDDLALMEALVAPAFYVGALGSHANSAKRRARLRGLDLPEAAVARLHAPIGLPIGSRTPAEIAVAILAELTAVRHGRALATASAFVSVASEPQEPVTGQSSCGRSAASC